MKKRHTHRGVIIELERGDLPDAAMTHKQPVSHTRPEPTQGRFEIRIAPEAVAILGHHGRLLSGSKSAYSRAHPEHRVYFNACIFDEGGVQIWFGDLDLTLERGKLEQLVQRLGAGIYVTPEHPYRFEGLKHHECDDQIIHLPGPQEVERPDGC